MATFSQIKAGLDEVATKNKQQREILEKGFRLINEALAALTAMPEQYSDLVSSVDAALAANPTNEAFVIAAAEKGELVKDFQALKATAEEAITALDPIING